VRAPLRAISPLVAGLDTAYGSADSADNAALQLLTQYIGILEDTEALVGRPATAGYNAYIHDLMALAIGATRMLPRSPRVEGARARLRMTNKISRPNWTERPVGGDNCRTASDQATVDSELFEREA